MADWTNLPNQAVGVGGLPSGTTVTALRDNPVAIAEGAAGAPRIKDGALDTTATNAGRNWVLARNALASAGAVGTYVCARGSGNVGFGSTVSGSALFATSAVQGFQNIGLSGSFPTTSTPSGTWRCMGRFTDTVTLQTSDPVRNIRGATLWLRIS